MGNLYKNATPTCPGGCGNLFFADTNYYGTDNIRDHLDFYISRTHIKILVNGTTYVDQDTPDIGFDRAYVYLNQASYNPCKDLTAPNYPNGQCDEKWQIFHWDNFAFDGPKLAKNSLTPVGSRDIVFNAGWTNSCSFKGKPATLVGPAGSGTGSWSTYVVRVPDDGTSATASDVSCSYATNTNHNIYDFEVVKTGSGTTPPPPPVAVNPPPPPPVAVNPPPPPPTSGAVVAITGPTNGATVSGTITINAQTINSSGVTQVNFLIDGVSIGTDTTSPFFISWNTTTKTNGTHTITVRPMNITGPDATVTVTVNNPIILPPPPPAKVGDLNNDNLVNGSDLAIMLSKWGTADVAADLSKDGKVDSSDLAILLSKWGS